jgi:MFS family permease
MQSLWQVLKSQPRLWRPAMVGALSFAVFMAFWTSLPFLMMIKFHEGATETGLFGVVGLAGALAAPYAGKVADRRGGNFTVSMALLITLFSFGLMWVWGTIPGLIVGVLLMDVGVQTVQVAEQGRVLSLLPEARSRLNTLYMVSRFMGGAIGSLIGAFAWTHGQWPFVCGSILALVALGIVTHVMGMRFEGSRDASRYAGAQEIATIAQKVV